MKIIDEKGKLFGKVNVVDLAVGIIILFLICGIGYKVFFYQSKTEEVVEEKGTAYITLRATGLVPETENYLREGEKLILSDELSEVEVVSVTFKDTTYTGMNAEGELKIADNPLYKDMEITVKAAATEDEKGVALNGQILRVNQNFDIITEKISTTAKIIGIEFEEK